MGTSTKHASGIAVNGTRTKSNGGPPKGTPGLAGAELARAVDRLVQGGSRALHQVTTVNHQGTVIAFAREIGGTDIYYNVLDLKVTTLADNQEWTGFTRLVLPEELRPLGLGIVTVGDRRGTILADADAPLEVVSDERYVCLFQQSSKGTLLLNRLMLKRVAPSGGGEPIPVLEPVWEIRYQRSGKQDVPDGPRDTQGYIAADGTPFIEPVLELPMVQDLEQGRFEAIILPSQTGATKTWQIFAVNAGTKALDLFSCPMDEGGLFDLSGKPIDASGKVLPDVSVTLSLDAPGKRRAAAAPLILAGAPSATIYTLRERVRSTAGSDLLLKRTARVLLSQPVQRQPGAALEIATLDFALAKDGTLAGIDPNTTVTPVSPADYGLEFSAGSHLDLPGSPTLQLRGSFQAEFWLYLDSAVATDQYVFRGSSGTALDAAPYLKVTRDLHVEVGFGTGVQLVTARTRDAVVAPAAWVHVKAAFDSSVPSGNFSVLINDNTVPVVGADSKALPAGQPVTTIGGATDGILGILDLLRLWDASSGTPVPVGDWEFDSVNYDVNPPITPDSSPAKNDASVHGATLVPSTAPTSHDNSGTLQVDASGLTVYGGLLDFAQPGGSASLMTSADGMVHLYYQGRDGLFTVAQMSAESSRSVYEADWLATVPSGQERGQVQMVAARSGTFMNLARIAITPSSQPDLCEVRIDDGLGRTETWQGVPRGLGRYVSVLNGSSTDDLASPAFRSGQQLFYDNSGTYAMSRLAVQMPAADAHLTLLSRYPDSMQLGGASVTDVTDATCGLALTFDVPRWDTARTVNQAWAGLPVFPAALLPVLAGTSDSYDYSPAHSSNATVYTLPALDSSGRVHNLLLLARPDVTGLEIGIAGGSDSLHCDVTIAVHLGGDVRTFNLAGASRDQNRLAEAIDLGEAGRYLLALADGITALVQDRQQAPLDLADLLAWAAILVAFPDQVLAPDARMTAQGPVPAGILQKSTLTVDGKEAVLQGPSTMFRAVAANAPSNGGLALVQDTSSFTAGSANLVTAAVNGGWLRLSPPKAISTSGANAVIVDQASPTADVLAIPGDVSLEAWCRPGRIAGDADRPRLLTYHRLGSLDFPDERIRFGLGLHPAPSLRFGPSTAVYGSYALKDLDCTLQAWVMPGAAGSGQIMRLATVGVVKPYLTVTGDTSRRVTVAYADGTVALTTANPLPANGWAQVTVTLAVEGPSVRLRLFLNGALESEAVGSKVAFTGTPGAFSAGNTNGTFPMQANGVFMWRRALNPEEVRVSFDTPAPENDSDLVIAWYLTEGIGSSVQNVAVEGAPFVSNILNQPDDPWSKTGAYALPFAINRDYGILGRQAPIAQGWRHLASSYRTAYALRLPGDQYGDCGDDASLNLDSTLSAEAYFTPQRSGVVQTLISKPGNYEVALNYDNTVVFTVWTSLDGPPTRLTSDLKVEVGRSYYVVGTAETGTTKAAASKEYVAPTYFLRARLYLNGVLAKEFNKTDYADPVSISTSASRLNLGRNTAGAAYFTGSLSEVKLWNRALPADTIAATYRTHLNPSTEGLVSYWRFAESRGKVAYDSTGINNAILTSNTMWSLYAPASVLSLVVDGELQDQVEVVDPAALGGYGAEQLTFAANRDAGGGLANPYVGDLNEARIWRIARTPEQVREDMYRELTGAELGLAGCWTFGAGSGLVAVDATGHGNDGALYPAARPPLWVVSKAPISNEAPQVYNALGGIHTDLVVPITGVPSVVDYADTRRDAYGALFSVMKRCYTADGLVTADLIPGYTVGDLDTVYAGQVQTSPSLIGFIEGAPPMPSENQTNPWWNDVNYLNTYADTSSIRVTQASGTTRAFSGSEKTSDASSLGAKAGLFISSGVSNSFGLGEEVDIEIFTSESHLGAVSESKSGRDAESELGFGYGKTVTFTDELAAGGEWEPADRVLNPEVGRRYVPENIGYALVKSLTADLYLVTLRGSNTVVKMTLVPNADIPEDVNIINFPLDPHYVKNGTLDGMVGFKPDPDFPYANLQPSSYFRPIEAYTLKRSIEKQDKQLEAYYQQFDTVNLSKGNTLAVKNGALTVSNGFTKFRDETLPAEPSYDWKKGLAKRGLVNTYVWTAGGGLHSEQTELVDTYSESYSGVSSWDSSSGLEFDLAVAFVAGTYMEFDSLSSTALEVMSVKSKESESSFGLEVEFAPDRYLKRPVLNAEAQPVGYTEENAPGKVCGYRFMSFFLPPSERNFGKFQEVVDRNWLDNSASPDAAALRTATDEANGAWRVLHRVTYVGRVPPKLQPAATETAATPLQEPANLESNTVITRMVQEQIHDPVPTTAQIGAAVNATLGDSPANPGLLAQALPWWETFQSAAVDRRSDAHRTLAELRVDLLAYMVQKYAAEAGQAGGASIAALRS